MTQPPVHLDQAAVSKVASARWSQIVAELVDENARLTAYARLLEGQLQPPAQPDAWGDPAVGKEPNGREG